MVKCDLPVDNQAFKFYNNKCTANIKVQYTTHENFGAKQT